MENCLKNSRFIDEVIVIGNGRKFVSALIVPNFENLRQFAVGRHIEHTSDDELVADAQVGELYTDENARLCEPFAGFEQIKKFTILATPLTIESGELTPSLKVKRRIIESKYKDRIDSLYAE